MNGRERFRAVGPALVALAVAAVLLQACARVADDGPTLDELGVHQPVLHRLLR